MWAIRVRQVDKKGLTGVVDKKLILSHSKLFVEIRKVLVDFIKKKFSRIFHRKNYW